MELLTVGFQAIGGLGLFMYGMHKMSDGLKKISSDGIRNILAHLTRNRFFGILVGMAITMMVQSSSATTVMVVGFVNAGLLNLTQAVAVILGANIGTTMTAWIVSIVGKFKIAAYALPCIGVGFWMRSFCKKRKVIETGEIILGFGLLFFGLDIVKESFVPISKNQNAINFIASLATSPFLGVLAGAVLTILLQSSSATVAIVQLLAFNGVLTFETAIFFVLGENIGTTITAQLASIGTTINAKRAAMAHTLFNVFGVMLIMPIAYTGKYAELISLIMPAELSHSTIMLYIALSHTTFNVLNVIFFSVFMKFLVRSAIALRPIKESDAHITPKLLDVNLLDNPNIAMEQVIKELIRMANLAKITIQDAEKSIYDYDEKLIARVRDNEQTIDDFQNSITKYLIQISERHLDTRESGEYPVLLHSVNDIEKLGDYASNLIHYADVKARRKIALDQAGLNDVKNMFVKLYELCDIVILSLKTRSIEKAATAMPIEDEIDEMKAKVKEDHIERLRQPDAVPEGEMMIMDIASNVEKMGDHLFSIAKAVKNNMQWSR